MFSQTTEYALRAMACLALAPHHLVPTNALAEMTKVPGNYLAKVLQQLAQVGLINGRRGVGGGYRLARPAANINLLDVINAVDALKRREPCTPNSDVLCPLHRALDAAEAQVMASMQSVTLQSLLDDIRFDNRPLCHAVAPASLSVTSGARSGRAVG